MRRVLAVVLAIWLIYSGAVFATDFYLSDANENSSEDTLVGTIENAPGIPQFRHGDGTLHTSSEDGFWKLVDEIDFDKIMTTATKVDYETYAPAQAHSITYEINDGSIDHEVVITVADVNENPEVTETLITISMNEGDGDYTIDLSTYVTDPENDTLTYHLYSLPDDTLCTLLDSGDGTITLSGATTEVSDGTVKIHLVTGDIYGNSEFLFLAKESATSMKFKTAQKQIAIQVTAVDDPPVAAAFTSNITEDTDVTITLGSHVVDVEDNVQTFTIVSLPDSGTGTLYAYDDGQPGNKGAAVVQDQAYANNLGRFILTPASDVNGTFVNAFTFKAADETSDSNTAGVTLEISAVNDAPTAAGSSVTTNEDTVLAFSAADFNYSDVDNDPLSKIKVVTPENIGTLFLDANANDANDGEDILLGQELASAMISMLKFLPEPEENGVTYTLFEFQVHDGTVYGDTVYSMAIHVNVSNDAPQFAAGADQAVDEDSGSHTASGWATGMDPGPDDESGQNLSFSAVPDDTTAFSVQPAVDSASGDLTYTLADDAFGEVLVTVTLSDDGGTANGGSDTSAEQTFTITIDGINDIPVFTKGANQTVNEDCGVQTAAGWATGVSAGPFETAQNLTFSVTAADTTLFSVQPAVDAAGQLSYTPAADENGSTTVTVSLSDDGGTANGGTDTSADQTFTITIDAVNDAPVFTKGADQTIDEDSGAYTSAGWATGISPGPGDESGQTLTFTVTAADPSKFSVQPAVDTASGDLTFTPETNAFGSVVVSVTLSDNGGTAAGGSDTGATQTFTVNITNTNDSPVFTSTPSPTPISEDQDPNNGETVANLLSGRVTDSDDPNIGLAITTVDSTNGTWQYYISSWQDISGVADTAALLLDHTALIRFVPSGDWSGTATFTCRAWDQSSGSNGDTGVDVSINNGDPYAFSSTSETATLFIIAANDAPVFIAGSDQTVDEDTGAQTVSGWATGMDAGATNESGQTLTFSATAADTSLFSVQPAVDEASGDLTYTPAADAFGSTEVSVTLSDDGGTANNGSDTSAAQTITVSLTAVNDVPAFTKGSDQTVDEDSGAQTVTAWATGITAGAANESGQTMTFAVTATNTLLFSAQPDVDETSGDLTYTPADHANGSTEVSVILSDDGGTSNGGSDTSAAQTFLINLTALNDDPQLTASTSTFRLVQEGTVSITGCAVADLDVGVSNIGVTLEVAKGTITLAQTTGLAFSAGGDGQASMAFSGALVDVNNALAALQYDGAAGQSGADTLDITVNDLGNTGTGGGGDISDQVAVFINDAPALDNSGAPALTTVNEDDTDPGGDAASTLVPVPAVVTDTNGNTPGIALTGSNAESGGTWEYSTDAGGTWTSVPTVSDSSALLLEPDDMLRFVPVTDFNSDVNRDGTNEIFPSITYRAWDQTEGTAGATVEITSYLGGTWPYSTDAETAVVTVDNTNDTPTDMTLSPSAIDENATGAAVGVLSTTDIDGGDSFTYTVVEDESGYFQITGATLELKPAAFLNYEVSSSHGITVEVEDSGSSTFEKVLTVTVNDVNDPPVAGFGTALKLSGGGYVTIPADAMVNVGGGNIVTFSAWIRPDDVSGTQVFFHQPADAGELAVSLYLSGSQLVYELVNEGASSQTHTSTGSIMPGVWNHVAMVKEDDDTTTLYINGVLDSAGTPIASSILSAATPDEDVVLGAMDEGSNPFSGEVDEFRAFGTALDAVTITAWSFRGLDETHPAILYLGAYFHCDQPDDTSLLNTGGGPDGTLVNLDSADFVDSTVSGWIMTEDAPGGGTLPFFDEDGDLAYTYSVVTTPVDGSAAITNPSVNVFTYDPGSDLHDLAAGETAEVTFSFSVHDGTTSALTAETVYITVQGVNDAPVMDDAGDMKLTDIYENAADPAGDLVSAVIVSAGGDRVTDVDTAALEGVSVTAADSTDGTWEYSINSGGTWSGMGTVSGTESLLLRSTDMVRFVPNQAFDGTVDPGLTFRAWDQTAGTAGISADTSSNGGSTAYGITTETAAITVIPWSAVAFAAATSEAKESVTAVSLDVTVTPVTGLTVEVDYAVTDGTAAGSGVDYTLAAGTLTILPGVTVETIDFTVVEDTSDEDDETVEVTVSNPEYAYLGTVTAHTYTIQDNDYSITPSAGAGGGISPSSTVVVTEGNNQLFTMLPDTGWAVQDILVGGVSQGAADTYEFTSVSADNTISVSFMDVTKPEIVTVQTDDSDDDGHLNSVIFTYDKELLDGEEDINDWVVIDADGVTDLLSGLGNSAVAISGVTVTITLADTTGSDSDLFWAYLPDGQNGEIKNYYGVAADKDTTTGNATPVANAGANQQGPPQLITLDGSASSDADNHALTYLWELTSGPMTVSFSDETAAKPGVIVRAVGTYTFTLTVKDPLDFPGQDTVQVTVSNAAPIAVAGIDQSIVKDSDTDADFVLDGSNSRDANSFTGSSDIASYAWSVVSGPTEVSIVEDSLTTPTATFDTSVLAGGAYEFMLTVTDTAALLSTDTVLVTINDPNNYVPDADAGPDITTLPDKWIMLSGHESKDTDGTLLSYAWTQTGGPTVQLLNNTTVQALFLPITTGVYEFKLVVNDGQADSLPDYIKVEALASPADIPVAGIKNPVTEKYRNQVSLVTNLGEAVTLEGAVLGSSDGVTTTWSQLEGAAVEMDEDSLSISFSPVEEGVHVFALDAVRGSTQGRGATATVTVISAAANPPTASAGADQLAATAGTTVMMNGSGTDADNDTVTYTWNQVSGPVVILSDPASDDPTFVPVETGVYEFELVVSDGYFYSVPNRVYIVVNSDQNNVPTAGVANEEIQSGVNSSVILSASGSSDTDAADTLTYFWEQIYGPPVLLDNPYSAVPSFIPQYEGDYGFYLYVDDGNDRSIPKEVVVTVTEGGAPAPTPPGGTSDEGVSNSACFVATAAYGTPAARELDLLRAVRDRCLLPTAPGRALVNYYYRFSPPAARVISEDVELRRLSRNMLNPVVRMLSLMW